MPHPLVTQLRFTREKWLEGLDGVSDEEALKRFGRINPIGWIVGHLAAHEQNIWLKMPQGKLIAPEVDPCASGQPASTPQLAPMLDAWRRVTQQADLYLETLTTAGMAQYMMIDGKPYRETIGTMMLRLNFHYWYHLGEMQSIRQLLGHTGLSGFVGRMPPELYEAE